MFNTRLLKKSFVLLIAITLVLILVACNSSVPTVSADSDEAYGELDALQAKRDALAKELAALQAELEAQANQPTEDESEGYPNEGDATYEPHATEQSTQDSQVPSQPNISPITSMSWSITNPNPPAQAGEINLEQAARPEGYTVNLLPGTPINVPSQGVLFSVRMEYQMTSDNFSARARSDIIGGFNGGPLDQANWRFSQFAPNLDAETGSGTIFFDVVNWRLPEAEREVLQTLTVHFVIG